MQRAPPKRSEARAILHARQLATMHRFSPSVPRCTADERQGPRGQGCRRGEVALHHGAREGGASRAGAAASRCFGAASARLAAPPRAAPPPYTACAGSKRLPDTPRGAARSRLASVLLVPFPWFLLGLGYAFVRLMRACARLLVSPRPPQMAHDAKESISHGLHKVGETLHIVDPEKKI